MGQFRYSEMVYVCEKCGSVLSWKDSKVENITLKDLRLSINKREGGDLLVIKKYAPKCCPNNDEKINEKIETLFF